MEKFFKLKENHTDVRTEVIAGMTTFITMAEGIFVSPDILSAKGREDCAVMTATIIAAGLTTILMGLLTNYPFALASGMGLNAFFAFVVAEQYGWQAALGAVFISGVIFLILSVTRAIGYIDAALPTTLKRAVAAGIGLFIAYIGLQNGVSPIRPPRSPWANLPSGPLLTLIGILIIAVLMARGVGGDLDRDLLTTVVSFFMGIRRCPPGSEISSGCRSRWPRLPYSWI